VAIAPSAGFVYWTDEGTSTVRQATVAGTGQQNLATSQPIPIGIAVDLTHVYWVTRGGGASVRKRAKP
jgi:hypothetical protein